MQLLLRAVRYLTILPVPGRTDPNPAALGAAAAWFPVVGVGLGLVLVVVERVAGRVFPVLLAALLTVTVWKLLTGGLHLDGLADCLDGLVGSNPGQRLAIMRDSRIGAFGAIGLILFLLLEIAALVELGALVRWRALLTAPMIGRAMPVLLGRLFLAAKADGHGASFRASLRPSAAPIALGIALAVAFATLGIGGVLAVAVAAIVTLALGRFFLKRLGGITGDVLGATVEVAELTTLLTVSAWVHAGR